MGLSQAFDFLQLENVSPRLKKIYMENKVEALSILDKISI